MYSTKVSYCSKELTGREKIKVKDTSNALSLDKETDNGIIVLFTLDYYAVLDVHNDDGTPPDYHNYILVDKNGTKYVTGSDSFYSAFSSIMSELEGEETEEDIQFEIYKKESKNYKGKHFITCSLA